MMGPNPKTFTGRVISLSAQATLPNQGEGSNRAMFGDPSSVQAKVEAKVVLDQPSKMLIPGSLVSVEVITDQRQNVVAIPPEAVQQAGPNPFVWLKDDQSSSNSLSYWDYRAYNKSRLRLANAGDQLVLAPPNTSLAAGMSLKLQPTCPDATPTRHGNLKLSWYFLVICVTTWKSLTNNLAFLD